MAQLVEQCVRNAWVRGSNPLISTKKHKRTRKCPFSFIHWWGGFAQLCCVQLCCRTPDTSGLALIRPCKHAHFTITAFYAYDPLISTKKHKRTRKCPFSFVHWWGILHNFVDGIWTKEQKQSCELFLAMTKALNDTKYLQCENAFKIQEQIN